MAGVGFAGLALGFWFVCALFSAVVASSKGRSGAGWFVLGFLFGPLALLAAVGVAARASPDQHLFPCRACKTPIDPTATICPHCRTESPIDHDLLVRVADEKASRARKDAIWIAVIAAILVAIYVIVSRT